MSPRNRVLAVPVVLTLAALALAVALTPCLSRMSASPVQPGADGAAAKRQATKPCGSARKT